MAKKQRRIPPSRIKYTKNHPTVSARLPKEKRESLLAVLKSLGVTLTQLLLHFISEYEIKVKSIEEARKAGYEEAKKLYMVPFACSVCGEPLAITSPKAKEIAGRYMTEHGWGHAECHRKAKPQKQEQVHNGQGLSGRPGDR